MTPVKGPRVPLTSDGVARVPDSPGVFQLETDTEVIFIGMAETGVRGRILDHLWGTAEDCTRAATHVTVEVNAKPVDRLQELLRETLLATGHLPRCNSGSVRQRKDVGHS